MRVEVEKKKPPPAGYVPSANASITENLSSPRLIHHSWELERVGASCELQRREEKQEKEEELCLNSVTKGLFHLAPVGRCHKAESHRAARLAAFTALPRCCRFALRRSLCSP